MSECNQVEEFVTSTSGAARGGAPAGLRMHLDRCAPCRRLFEFFTCNDGRAVPEAVRLSVERRLRGSLEPVRPLPCHRTLAFAFVLIFAGGPLLWSSLSGWDPVRGMTLIQLMGTMLAVCAAGAFTAVSLGKQMVPGERRLAPAAAVPALALTALAALVLVIFPWEASGSHWLDSAMTCSVHGAMIALPTAAAAFFLFRRGATLCPATAGGAIGLLAGLAAMATLHLGCPMHGALHIVAGHLSLPACGALIGYALGKAIGRWDAREPGRSIV